MGKSASVLRRSDDLRGYSGLQEPAVLPGDLDRFETVSFFQTFCKLGLLKRVKSSSTLEFKQDYFTTEYRMVGFVSSGE